MHNRTSLPPAAAAYQFTTLNALRGIRYVDGPDGAAPAGGDAATDAAAATAAADAAAAAATAAGEGEIDYKAKYEETLKHSRDWEAKSKANFEKAKQFDDLEESKKSDVQKATDRALKAEEDAQKSAAELLQLRAANTHGITASERVLLTATTEEALKEQAAAIVAHRAPAAASAKGAGLTAGGKTPAKAHNTLESAISAHYTA